MDDYYYCNLLIQCVGSRFVKKRNSRFDDVQARTSPSTCHILLPLFISAISIIHSVSVPSVCERMAQTSTMCMMMSYRASLALNNIGISLLQRGFLLEANQVFLDSTSLMKACTVAWPADDKGQNQTDQQVHQQKTLAQITIQAKIERASKLLAKSSASKSHYYRGVSSNHFESHADKHAQLYYNNNVDVRVLSDDEEGSLLGAVHSSLDDAAQVGTKPYIVIRFEESSGLSLSSIQMKLHRQAAIILYNTGITRMQLEFSPFYPAQRAGRHGETSLNILTLCYTLLNSFPGQDMNTRESTPTTARRRGEPNAAQTVLPMTVLTLFALMRVTDRIARYSHADADADADAHIQRMIEYELMFKRARAGMDLLWGCEKLAFLACTTNVGAATA